MTEGRSGAGVFAVRLIQIAVLLAVVLLVWRLSGVLILFFASLLLAIAFAAIAQGFMKLLPIPRRMAVGLSVLALIGSLGAVVGLYGWRIAGQYDEIYAKALQGAQAALTYVRTHEWGRYLLNQASGARIADATDVLGPLLGALIGATGAYLAYGVIIIVCGVFLALDPDRYLGGVLALVAPSHKALAERFLARTGAVLRLWLISRLIVMAAIGVLASTGLTLLGIPAALTLGLTGALLTFVPYIGALLAAAPAVLVAFTVSPMLAFLTGMMFWGVHFIEGTFITPIVQDEEVDLPPVVTIFATLAFGVLFGVSGVILASPLILVVIVATQIFYIEVALGQPAYSATGGALSNRLGRLLLQLKAHRLKDAV